MNFITVDGGRTIINLEQVAYIERLPEVNGPSLLIAFAAAARSHFEDINPEPLSLLLTDDEATRFMAAVMLQTATW